MRRLPSERAAQAGSRTDSTMADELRVPVSVGELMDNITILQIKSERIASPAQLDNVRRELEAGTVMLSPSLVLV
jgi:hypothetical protein